MFAALFSNWARPVSVGAMILFSILFFLALWHLPAQLKMDKQWLSENSVQTQEEIADVTTQDTMLLISKIPEAHLFGHALEENVKDLPITSLQLRLIGVIASLSDKSSRVIISEASLPGKVYQVGSHIGPVRVSAITQNGVILEHNGRLEKLPLQRDALSFQGMPKKLLIEE
jgi:type II secretory pathway component PulC